jgi:hypothetical protein
VCLVRLPISLIKFTFWSPLLQIFDQILWLLLVQLAGSCETDCVSGNYELLKKWEATYLCHQTMEP